MEGNGHVFFEKPYRPLESMSLDELKSELQQWRNIWTWLDADVQYWLTKVGNSIRVSLRNGQTFKGTLGSVEYQPVMLKLEVYERIYDYGRGEATYETKMVAVKITDMVGYQFIFNEDVRVEPLNPAMGETSSVDSEPEI